MPCVVVDHHVVHHSGLVIAVLDAEDVSFYAVIERSCRNLYLLLCPSDVVAKSVNLVICHRNEVVRDEERADTYREANYAYRKKDAGEGYACGLHRQQLVAFGEVAERHH